MKQPIKILRSPMVIIGSLLILATFTLKQNPQYVLTRIYQDSQRIVEDPRCRNNDKPGITHIYTATELSIGRLFNGSDPKITQDSDVEAIKSQLGYCPYDIDGIYKLIFPVDLFIVGTSLVMYGIRKKLR